MKNYIQYHVITHKGEESEKEYTCLYIYGFPCGSAGKESACSMGDLGLIPGL